MLRPLLHLLYPHVCGHCGQELSGTETVLCLRCAFQLPATGFQGIENNPVARIFWGRVSLQHAMAGYYFSRHSCLQGLIHQFKYHGRQDIAAFLGRQLGLLLQQSDWWQEISLVLPVPLSAVKQRRRGYNQAAILAESIAGVLNCAVLPEGLRREPLSVTQTHKSRLERWENVSTVFALNRPEALQDQHVLLVDDVLTTGATLEACAQAVLGAGEVKVSVCSLAYASK